MTTQTPEEIEFKAMQQAQLDAKRYVDSLKPFVRIDGYQHFETQQVHAAFIAGRQEKFEVTILAAEQRGREQAIAVIEAHPFKASEVRTSLIRKIREIKS